MKKLKLRVIWGYRRCGVGLGLWVERSVFRFGFRVKKPNMPEPWSTSCILNKPCCNAFRPDTLNTKLIIMGDLIA